MSSPDKGRCPKSVLGCIETKTAKIQKIVESFACAANRGILNFVPNESSRVKFYIHASVVATRRAKEAVTIPYRAGAAFVDTIPLIKTTYNHVRTNLGNALPRAATTHPRAIYRIADGHCQVNERGR